METASDIAGVRRITDLVEAKAAGAVLRVRTCFEILPAPSAKRPDISLRRVYCACGGQDI